VKRTQAERLYALLLRVHPPSFRRDHGVEILQHVRTAAARDPQAVSFANAVRDGLSSLSREWGALLFPRRQLARQQSREPMRSLLRDIKLSARTLRKSPPFTLAAILTLALGIGANTAMFTLAESTVLRPVHVREPENLVVWSWTSSYPDYEEYAKRTDVFDGVAAIGSGGRLNFVVDGAAELPRYSFVTGRTFDVLGVRAALGRTIQPADDIANGPIVAVLTYDYWRTRFGSDPSIVGRTFRANGRQITIVGVLEQGFRGVSLSSNPPLYLPAGTYNQLQTGFFARVNALTARGFVWLNVIPRLRADVPAEQAATAMTALYAQLHPREPGEKPEPVTLTPLPARALGRRAEDVKTFVAVLVGVVGLTLLIGCANLANLLLARANARRREVGVRLALGATRGGIARLLVMESVMLAVAGGAAGLLVARLAFSLLSAYELPGGIAIENVGLEIDATTLVVTAGLSLVTGVFFSLLPAWRASRTDVLIALRDQGRGATSRGMLRRALLAVQVALSLVLLAGTGLFARSLQSGLSSPLGFNVRGVASASVSLGLARYDEGRARAFYAAAVDRLKALPQVTSAAWATMIPTRGSWVNQTRIDGYVPASGEDVTVNMSQVGPDYFRTIGARLLEGREFTNDDKDGAPAVAVVNEAMAKKYWNSRAIGGRFEQFDRWVTVVGIVENAVTTDLRGDPQPFAYLAFTQSLTGKRSVALDPVHLFVRMQADADATVAILKEQLRTLDPELPLYDAVPFEQHVAALVMPQRMGVVLFTLFSTLATALAAVGIYGVSSYVASMRTREIGVRVALGATRAAVRRMVLIEGARPVLIGMACGLLLALYATRLISAFLLDVSRFDPASFVGATLLLAVIALGASYLPAWRAARIEPVAALRDE
jgi:putative ABC transport system permease protein